MAPLISFVVMILVGYLIEPSDAFKYYVGGKDGWCMKPSKSFNQWASLNRFQVHDTLIFKYQNGTDSVLQVEMEDYITCNKTNPILALENKGDYSTFNLDHSGFFFFISGHTDNCKKGQKVIILVMAPRNHSSHTSPTPAPSPIQRATSPAPLIARGISPVSSQAPSPFRGISPVSSQAPSPFRGISQGLPPAPSPIRQVAHGLPPAHAPVQKITPKSSPAPSQIRGVPHPHAVPPAHAPAHSTHHHTQSPAPSPNPKATHVRPPAPSPIQKITPISSPAPAASGPSQAASPGPSDQAQSPDNGKSAAAPTSFGGDLVITVLLFWVIFN